MQTTYTRDKTKNALKRLKPLCGDCEGFCNTRLIEGLKGFCKDSGKTKVSKICRQFQPNTIPLKEVADSTPFELLTQAVSGLNNAQVRAFATMLYAENNNRRLGYHFGQVVYIRYRGKANANYVSNFMRAYVMSAVGEYLKVMSEDGRCTASFLLANKNQIFTVEEFDGMRTRMTRLGRLVDPDVTTLLNRVLQAEERYELGITEESLDGKETTIDTVFKENKIGRRKTVITDLSDIVKDISSGIMVSEDEVKSYKRKVRVVEGKPQRKNRKDTKVDLSGGN